MKLFKKPKWLLPELDEPKYWLHIVILTGIVLLTLKYVFDHDMLNYGMFWKVAISITIADTIAHSSLGLK